MLDGLPVGDAGRVRAGLETWLVGQLSDFPAVLVEAARALADQVDREPRNSPLWGRYTALLMESRGIALERVVEAAERDALIEIVEQRAYGDELRTRHRNYDRLIALERKRQLYERQLRWS